MRPTWLLLLLILPPVHAVSITEVYPDPTDGQREFIEIWNPGEQAWDLSGWSIADAAGNTFVFDGQHIGPDSRIVVWGGGVSDARGPAWSKATVWNNDGDTATLFDASGVVVDSMSYGNAAPDAPPRPDKGISLQWWDGGWHALQPTPGSAPGASTHDVSASVEDVPPTISITAPATMEAGGMVTVQVEVADGNGDPVTWDLFGDGVLLASGEGSAAVELAVPSDRDTWTLSGEARDPAGNLDSTFVEVAITYQGIVVDVPTGGISFDLSPGAASVTATGSFTMENKASVARSPRIDVSDFAGPADLPVAGRLDIGIGAEGSQTWITYDGPMTPLPDMAPGEVQQVWLRLRDVPRPLPAGDYGTSFTVVS